MRYSFFVRFVAVLIGLSLFPGMAFAQTPNDPRYDEQWYLDAIAAPSAWDVQTGQSSVVVAVLDTGLDFDHEDIAANLWTNTGEIPDNGIDDDANGFVDDIHGWDFVENDADVTPVPSVGGDLDVASHGTLIAGEIGAVGNNAVGVSGVAWNVSIMPVRMLGADGSGTEENAAQAIRYAVHNGAKVINLSFAGSQAHSALSSAVQEAYAKGVVVVAAMGNDGKNTDRSPVYPACLRTTDDDWVIGVTATTEYGLGAGFTNYGSICADIAAPGTNISGLSYFNNTTGAGSAYLGGWSGTSMASPLVAGAAALLFSEYPTLSAKDVRNILKLSVDPVQTVGYAVGSLGSGILNVARALEIGSLYAPSAQDVSTPDAPAQPSGDTVRNPGDTGSDNVLEYSYLAFGAPAGVSPDVVVLRATGEEYSRFSAYGSSFLGGVHVATMYIEDDYSPTIITGAGDTGGPHVRVFSSDGKVKSEFFAYGSDSRRGVSVAVGDVNGDGVEDIVTSVGSGVSQDIVTWSASGTELSRFTASLFPDSSPLTVATVDYDDDDAEEIAVIGQIDGVARVALYDSNGAYLVDFTPYTGTSDVSVSRVDNQGSGYDNLAITSLHGTNDLRLFTKIGALSGSAMIVGQPLSGNRVVGVHLDLDGVQDLVLSENVDGGRVTLLSSDLHTILGTFAAPVFHANTGAFLAVW